MKTLSSAAVKIGALRVKQSQEGKILELQSDLDCTVGKLDFQKKNRVCGFLPGLLLASMDDKILQIRVHSYKKEFAPTEKNLLLQEQILSIKS